MIAGSAGGRSLAATGLRISEALALQCDDLGGDGLIIRNGKFGKQRLIALQPSTRQALEAYLATRARLGATGSDLFVTIRGGLSGFPCVGGHNGQEGVPLCPDARNR